MQVRIAHKHGGFQFALPSRTFRNAAPTRAALSAHARRAALRLRRNAAGGGCRRRLPPPLCLAALPPPLCLAALRAARRAAQQNLHYPRTAALNRLRKKSTYQKPPCKCELRTNTAAFNLPCPLALSETPHPHEQRYRRTRGAPHYGFAVMRQAAAIAAAPLPCRPQGGKAEGRQNLYYPRTAALNRLRKTPTYQKPPCKCELRTNTAAFNLPCPLALSETPHPHEQRYRRTRGAPHYGFAVMRQAAAIAAAPRHCRPQGGKARRVQNTKKPPQ